MKAQALNQELIRDLLRTASADRLLRIIGRTHPADIAPLFKDLEPVEVQRFFDLLFATRRAGKVLKELPPELLPEILSHIEDEKLAKLSVWLHPDDEVRFLHSLPEERREKILSLVDPDRRERVEQVISYPEGSVGRIMTTEYLALQPETTAQGAIDKIRERGELETFFYLYVVDEAERLCGVVPIRNLVITPPDRRLKEIMIADPLHVEVTTDQEEAARLVSRYDLLALPIVDQNLRLCGIVTVDDVIDIIDKETTEDMYRMAGLEEEDRVFTTVTRSVRLRLPWTVFNLLTATLAASVVGLFQNTLQQVIALAMFMPIVAGVGGNGATQTATVIVRGIALGEIEFSSAWRAIVKQISVNICIAIVAGVLIAVVTTLVMKRGLMLGAVVALAMIVNLGLVAGFSGAAIPLTLKWLKLDPALGSGIIVTGLTDACGFLSFLGLATLFLSYLT